MEHRSLLSGIASSALVLVLASAPALAQTGHVLNGVGAVNQSMAGASTAAPLDASGAVQWNPAAITGLEKNEIEFSMEVMRPHVELRSSVPTPLGVSSGTSTSEPTDSPIPSFGFVYHLAEDSPWTFGFGAFGLSGFGVNYKSSASNPLLMPPPNGFGSLYSEYQMLQVSPTFAYRIDDRWSVGFAPTFDQASLAVDPACFSPPDDANGDGIATYPSGANAAKSWGMGGQVGVFFRGDAGWNFGASYKTTQWLQSFSFNSTDELGNLRQLKEDMDFPAIVSLGTAYTGFEKWTLAADLRYIDYSHTNGFEATGFRPDGSVTGFGWDSILVLALGVQYEVNDCLSFRGGYSFNENPISDADSSFNVLAPGIIQNHVALGASWCVEENWFFDLAYRHGFENSVAGPMAHPAYGSIPGSTVENTMSTDSVVLGFRVDF